MADWTHTLRASLEEIKSDAERPRIVSVRRAASTGVRPVIILVRDELLAGLAPMAAGTAAYHAAFQEDARAIAAALTASLPGGTLDALTGLLLERKASELIVPVIENGVRKRTV